MIQPRPKLGIEALQGLLEVLHGFVVHRSFLDRPPPWGEPIECTLTPRGASGGPLEGGSHGKAWTEHICIFGRRGTALDGFPEETE
jgi:hypothetical protein